MTASDWSRCLATTCSLAVATWPMPKRHPHIDAHIKWIGSVRPMGVVVSAPALVRVGGAAARPRGAAAAAGVPGRAPVPPDGEPAPWLPDFRAFAASVLGWSFSPKGYAGTDDSPMPPELEMPLQEGREVLGPDFAVRERHPRDDGSRRRLLVEAVEPGDDFDRVAGGARRPEVSAHGRMERLLRQTGGAGGAAVERPHPAPRLDPAGRELGLARPARSRHGHHRGPAHRGWAAAAGSCWAEA